MLIRHSEIKNETQDVMRGLHHKQNKKRHKNHGKINRQKNTSNT